MTDYKVSELDEITEVSESDLLLIVDESEDTSNYITVGALMELLTLKRDYERLAVTVDVVADATAIDMRNWAGGSVKLTETHTNVYVYADLSEAGTGTYVQAQDKAGTDLQLRLDGTNPVPLPEEVYNYPWIKLVSTVEDTGAVVFLKG